MEEILREFSIPPATDETDSDRRLLQGAGEGSVPFEGRTLATYAWGEGPGVLLAHGWGSRASHLSLIARGLAKTGRRVVAFDAPAHGRSRDADGPPRSNGFEFARAIHAVHRACGPFAAVVGHSLSAIAAAWAAAGLGALAPWRIETGSLALVSSPAGINELMANWCARRGLAFEDLKRALDREFSCDTDDYGLAAALARVTGRVLVVHDLDDEEAPADPTIAAARAARGVDVVVTRGLGHGRILGSRETLRAITTFLGEA
jgi:pimeloyl-ACP methyl ester carboxylesterase